MTIILSIATEIHCGVVTYKEQSVFWLFGSFYSVYGNFQSIRPIHAVNAFFMQYIIRPMVSECPVKIWRLYDSSIKNERNFLFQAKSGRFRQ